ncbi:MAG: hypothetical protein L0Z51_08195, partial [Candidatus Latescibacteria bacterium]|nr:hypothetical protein [Candidatus Latescibacterota bacterium]
AAKLARRQGRRVVDKHLGFVQDRHRRGDAGYFHSLSLVLLASHIGIREILTVDRRDFQVYRLLDGREFVQVLS